MTGLAFIPQKTISYFAAPSLVMMRVDNPSKYDRHFFAAMDVACNVWGVTEDKILGVSRLHHIIRARMFVFHFMLTTTEISLQKLGKRLNRHHSTVIHARRRLANVLNGFEPEFLQEILKAETETMNILGLLNN